MAKSKFTTEEKLRAVLDHVEGGESLQNVAQRVGVGITSVQRWVSNYRAMGEEGLRRQERNTPYSKEQKEEAVLAYLRGEGSYRDICEKYQIRSNGLLRHWIRLYMERGELRAGGQGEGGAQRGRAFSPEERREIVCFYIEHQRDHRATMEKYPVSYQQIYSWCRSYDQKGPQGLEGRKGRATSLPEREEIVRYCIAMGYDYRAAMEKYGVTYQQVYTWVRRYGDSLPPEEQAS